MFLAIVFIHGYVRQKSHASFRPVAVATSTTNIANCKPIALPHGIDSGDVL